MSLDINPKVPYLIAAGFYDGTVSVYDLRLYDKQDLAFCIKSDTKHYDPVWQVCLILKISTKKIILKS